MINLNFIFGHFYLHNLKYIVNVHTDKIFRSKITVLEFYFNTFILKYEIKPD